MDIKDHTITFFAPAGRVSIDELNNQIEATLSHPLTKVILESVSGFVLILNDKRQILNTNQEVMDSLKCNSVNSIIGLRPGEVFNCAHAQEGPDGCGTSFHCSSCGAVISILSSQKEQISVENECQLTINKDGQFMAAEFKVKATPLIIGDYLLTILILQDISSIKRREILERVFVHDLFNAIGGIQGWSEQLNKQNPDVAAQQIFYLSSLIKEEIQFHSLLIQAEKDELTLKEKLTNAKEIFDRLENVFSLQQISKGKHLEVFIPDGENNFTTDESLLLRVLINMLKNAFEASENGETIQLIYKWMNGHPSFYVHNQAHIAREIQEHIFERSFSTKGKGRGIGTYSIKLIGEQYLKGNVGFRSTIEDGTSFFIILPANSVKNKVTTKQIESTPSEKSQSTQESKKSVLLVEDDEAFGYLEKLLLEKLGYQVQHFRNGIEAEKAYAIHPEDFGLIITDHSMMPINGLELAQRLLKINTSAIIILCTGNDDPKLAQEAKTVGVSITTFKPNSFEEMKNILLDAGQLI